MIVARTLRSRRAQCRCAFAFIVLVMLQAMTAWAAAPIQLLWQTTKIGTAESPSDAVFVLTNTDTRPLPASGWAIYFNCLAGAVEGESPAHTRIERVNHGFYRLVPSAGFQAIAPGESVRLPLQHPVSMFNIDKAPKGPYFVSDADPETGHAITDYRVVLPTSAEQADRPPDAQEIFERNSTIADLPVADLPPVFPTPRRFTRGKRSVFWPALPRIEADADLANEAEQARELLAPYFDPHTRRHANAMPLALRIGKVDGATSAEAYELAVEARKGVRITGNTAAGVARGLQSLRDLLPLPRKTGRGVKLAAIRLVDAPRFPYRGLMFDVARNFHDKHTVFKLLDLMARIKLNTLHFHLTDDEGWRLEIAGLPELTTYGARRGHSSNEAEYLYPAYGSGPDVNDARGSGYYSRADYIEILRYAAARHIEVIPEIEMPGHARAAIKAMDYRARHGGADAGAFVLTDPKIAPDALPPQSYRRNVMNPAMESTYAFIDHVVADIVAMHKEADVALTTLHVGGDEVPEGAWDHSPAVQALMQERHLDSTAKVWDVFYDRVDRILRAHGIAAAGWEELGALRTKLRDKSVLIPNPAFVQRGFTLQVWNNIRGNEDLAYRLANAGYDVVLSSGTRLYADMAYSADPDEPGMNWAAYIDLDDIFDFIPLDATRKNVLDPTPDPALNGLTEYGAQHLRGIEMTLFGENLRDPARIDYLLMPRLLAVAEMGWARDPEWTQIGDAARVASAHQAAWSIFVNQIGKRVLPRLDAERAGIAYRIPTPGVKRVGEAVQVNMQIPGFTLRYRSDGGEPDASSPVVKGALVKKGSLRVAAFNAEGRRGRSVQIENP